MNLRDKVKDIIEKEVTSTTPRGKRVDIQIATDQILQAVRDELPKERTECPFKDDDLALAWNDCIEEMRNKLL